MKTKTLTISLLLLTMLLVPLVLAEDEGAPRGPRGPRGGQNGPGPARGEFRGGPRMGGGMGDPFSGRMAEQLNLTDEQKTTIEKIQEENREQMQETRKALREANQALQEAIENGTDDEIMAAGKKLGEAYGKQGVLRAQTARKIKAVLTPEQVKKMEELRTQMRERMQQRMGARTGGGNRSPGAGNRPGRGEQGGRKRRTPQE